MNQMRQILRSKRRAIAHSEKDKLARKLSAKIPKISHLRSGQKLALYLPNDGEIDTKYIINFLKNRGISIYLPVLSGKKLKFAKMENRFKKNRFGISEPVSSKILNANQLNIILLPLVGFDANKNRLGMGGGFYDRTLEFKKRQNNYKNPKLYGLAFDSQKVEKIIPQAWDVALDGVITPTAIYR
ncbi:MAG: 5-formyltetrahydrofolate cyclo-ligase [Candidatus Thioglobus sp.]|nr:5-formyltetrahydrofolate cyclo-ligase [Candidatus Thioglobus sp.]